MKSIQFKHKESFATSKNEEPITTLSDLSRQQINNTLRREGPP